MPRIPWPSARELDMAMLEVEGFGERRIITASGAGKDGSLRVIQRGINVTSSATVEVEGIKRSFVLTRPSPSSSSSSSSGDGDDDDAVLALCFDAGVAFLQFEGEEVSLFLTCA